MLITAKNLSKRYTIEKGIFSNKKIIVNALEDINFQLAESKILGILGETGSGKTTLARLIVKLIQPTSGEIIYNLRDIRHSIQMIFQNPYNSLNPRMKIKNILEEPYLIHKLCEKKEINSKIKALLDSVNLDYDILSRFPEEFSGGQKQRIAIARAISLRPKILVCDEPTASLDVLIQAQILNLFIKLKEELKMSYIFISHNIDIISFLADEILVLYKGRCIERGLKDKILSNPQHTYTKMLLNPEAVIDNSFKINEDQEFCNCEGSEQEEIKLEEGHYVCKRVYR